MLLNIFKISELYIPGQQNDSISIHKDGLHYNNKIILAHFIKNFENSNILKIFDSIKPM